MYYADYYKIITGVDISSSMIQKAEDRLKNYNKTNVNLIVSDERKFWGNVSQSYDRITAGQVVQYFNLSQVEDFISESSKHLSNNGKIILFDIIDTDLFMLFNLGLFKERTSKFEIIKRFIDYNITKAIRIIKGLPGDELGKTYHPDTLTNIAKKYNLESERVSSMYYEYRYHLMFTKKPDIFLPTNISQVCNKP